MQVLVDGGMAYAQTTSNLGQGYTLMKMQAYHLPAHRWHQSIDALAKHFNFVLKVLGSTSNLAKTSCTTSLLSSSSCNSR